MSTRDKRAARREQWQSEESDQADTEITAISEPQVEIQVQFPVQFPEQQAEIHTISEPRVEIQVQFPVQSPEPQAVIPEQQRRPNRAFSVFHSLRLREQSATRIIPQRGPEFGLLMRNHTPPPPTQPVVRRRRAPENWRGGQRRPRRVVNLPPQPQVEEGPYDFSWGAVFVHLLWARLGRVQPYLSGLHIHDYSGTTMQFILIQSGLRIEGTNTEILRIELRYNHPAFGFSRDPNTANDWSTRTKFDRNERISLRPYEVFSHMHHVLPLNEVAVNAAQSRLVGFPAFTHSAYRLEGGGYLGIFHDDYNISEPVIQIVVMAIREYYRRAAGAPPAH